MRRWSSATGRGRGKDLVQDEQSTTTTATLVSSNHTRLVAPRHPLWPVPAQEGNESGLSGADGAGGILGSSAGVRQGDSGLAWRGINPTAGGRHWQPPSTAYDVYERLTGESLAHPPMLERLDRTDAAGLIYWARKGAGTPRFKECAEDMPGMPAQDVITDIPPINSQAAQRLGYPNAEACGANATSGRRKFERRCRARPLLRLRNHWRRGRALAPAMDRHRRHRPRH